MRMRAGPGRRTVAGAVGGALVAAGLLSLAGCGGDESSDSLGAPLPAAGVETLPEPVAPAFVPGAPKPLADVESLSWWSPVERPVVARAAPRSGAPGVARVEARTPEGTRNIVAVLGRRRDGEGALWVRVRLPILPNGSVGWVPREALGGYGSVRTRLVVDLGRLTATLYRDGRAVLSAHVGVGRPANPTPTGEFYVRNKLRRYANAFYGPVAFGTSARSPTLTDWPAGGFVGIHGTNRPELLPGRVSHGCIRLRNDDILRLERLMPVGTPVTIR